MSYIYAQVAGNFPTVTRVLLSKIPPVDGRMTYVYDEHVVSFVMITIERYVELQTLTQSSFVSKVSLCSRRRDMFPMHVR